MEKKEINIAKTFVIVLVVLGHVFEGNIYNYHGNLVDLAGHKLIYSFHMPFYFILSGYLFTPGQELREYFHKKIWHLMVPYLFWLLIFTSKALVGLIVNVLRGSMNHAKLSFYDQYFARQFFGGVEFEGYQIAFWFPTCLFFTQQLANYIFYKFQKSRDRHFIVGIVYLAALLNQFYYSSFHLPLAINIVAAALPFFYVGQMLKYISRDTFYKLGIYASALWCFIALFILSGLNIFEVHMRTAIYGVPIISVITAVGAFICILQASCMIKHRWIISICRPIANSSMTIMYLHVFFLIYCRELGIENRMILLLIGLVVPLLCQKSFMYVPYFRRLFSGGAENRSYRSVVRAD